MASRVFSGIATALIVAGGLFFLLLALGGHLQLLEARELMASGRQAEGEITDVRASKGRATTYHLDYAFAVGAARYANSDRSIGYADYHQMRRGMRVPVWYDASNPDRNITAAERSELEAIGNRLFLPGVALLLLGWAAYRILGKRILYFFSKTSR